jgi:hypothetical protein
MRELMRELKWTEAEKKLSRRAFDGKRPGNSP